MTLNMSGQSCEDFYDYLVGFNPYKRPQRYATGESEERSLSRHCKCQRLLQTHRCSRNSSIQHHCSRGKEDQIQRHSSNDQENITGESEERSMKRHCKCPFIRKHHSCSRGKADDSSTEQQKQTPQSEETDSEARSMKQHCKCTTCLQTHRSSMRKSIQPNRSRREDYGTLFGYAAGDKTYNSIRTHSSRVSDSCESHSVAPYNQIEPFLPALPLAPNGLSLSNNTVVPSAMQRVVQYLPSQISKSAVKMQFRPMYPGETFGDPNIRVTHMEEDYSCGGIESSPTYDNNGMGVTQDFNAQCLTQMDNLKSDSNDTIREMSRFQPKNVGHGNDHVYPDDNLKKNQMFNFDTLSHYEGIGNGNQHQYQQVQNTKKSHLLPNKSTDTASQLLPNKKISITLNESSKIQTNEEFRHMFVAERKKYRRKPTSASQYKINPGSGNACISTRKVNDIAAVIENIGEQHKPSTHPGQEQFKQELNPNKKDQIKRGKSKMNPSLSVSTPKMRDGKTELQRILEDNINHQHIQTRNNLSQN